MRYLDIIGRNPMPDRRRIQIPVRQLGFSKLVIVRTALNGWIHVKNIPVEA